MDERLKKLKCRERIERSEMQGKNREIRNAGIEEKDEGI